MMVEIDYDPQTGRIFADYPAGTGAPVASGYVRATVDRATITQQDDDPPSINLSALPPPPSLAEMQAAALRRVIAYSDDITSRITGRYPAAEVASWPTQEAEARLIQSGGAAVDAPLIAALAAAAAMSLSDFAAAVLDKAATYRQIVAAVQATRSRAEALIGACQSAGEIEAALITLRSEADAQAQAMGAGG